MTLPVPGYPLTLTVSPSFIIKTVANLSKIPPHSDPTCLKSQSLILHGVYLSIESTALHINLTGNSGNNPSLSSYLLEKHAPHQPIYLSQDTYSMMPISSTLWFIRQPTDLYLCKTHWSPHNNLTYLLGFFITKVNRCPVAYLNNEN